ncbi:MAG: hypothetical protein ACOX1P_04380 [Thermoguttaceae bacterium]|jgi:hypothetical protein
MNDHKRLQEILSWERKKALQAIAPLILFASPLGAAAFRLVAVWPDAEKWL